MFKRSKFSAVLPLAVLALLLSLVLAACGDPTATPVPKTADEALAGISGVKAVDFDPAIMGDSLKMFPGATVKMYVSDEDAKALFGKADSAVTAQGYKKFDLPPGSSTNDPNTNVNMYTKGENADLILAVGPVPSDPNTFTKDLNVPGMTPDQAQKLVDQIKGKKTFMFTLGTPGIFSAMIKGFSQLGTPSAGAAPEATTKAP